MITAKVSGVADLRRELAALPGKLRVRAVRNALAAGARLVRNAARSAAPVLSIGDPAVQAGRRKPGTVRKAIVVRTSKLARRSGDVGVFVNVRPAKAGQSGAKNPNDPFYWRFIQFGWNPASGPDRFGRAARRERRRLNRVGVAKRVPGVKFLEAGAAQLGAALNAIMPKLQAAIAKLNTPKAPPP